MHSAHCTPGLLKVHLSAHDEGPSFRHSSIQLLLAPLPTGRELFLYVHLSLCGAAAGKQSVWSIRKHKL